MKLTGRLIDILVIGLFTVVALGLGFMVTVAGNGGHSGFAITLPMAMPFIALGIIVLWMVLAFLFAEATSASHRNE